MSEPVKAKVARAFECFSQAWHAADSYASQTIEESRAADLKESYLRFLARRDPSDKAEIESIRACLAKENEAEKCLGQPHPLDENSLFHCSQLNEFSEQSRLGKSDSYHFASGIDDLLYLRPKNAQSLAPSPFIRELAEFHYLHLKDWQIGVNDYLRSLPRMALGLKAYDGKKVKPIDLASPKCTDSVEIERENLEIAGLAYRIPVDFVRGERAIRWFYLDALRAQFEVLKALLSPQDLEKILRPGSEAPNFKIVIGEWNTSNPKLYETCEIKIDPESSGEYHVALNRLDLTNGPWRLEDRLRSKSGAALEAIAGHASEGLGGTFYHEFGHAIYHHLLGKRERDVLRALYDRSVDAYRKEPRADHLPQGELKRHGTPYSMKNSGEFFAEMVTEYVDQKVTGRAPGTPGAKARYELMEALFAPQGIQLGALSAAAIEKAYERHGASISLDRTAFSLPLRANFNYLSVPVGERALQMPSIGFGLGLGFTHYLAPHGLFFGASGTFDYALPSYANVPESDGKNTVKTQGFDSGVLGAVGYAFPAIELSFEPGIGWRRLEVGEETRDRLWFGADANVLFQNYGLGFGVRGRGTTDGGHDLGLTVRLDVPKMVLFLE